MRILVNGCMDKNLGDDLFLKVLVERYSKISDLEWTVFIYEKKAYSFYETQKPNITLVRYPRSVLLLLLVKFFSFFCSKDFSEKIKRWSYKKAYIRFFRKNTFDIVLNIGGSMFAQYCSDSLYLTDCIFYYVNTFCRNSKKLLLGPNFGPFISNSFLDYYKNIFSSFSDLCFRDKKSFLLFKELSCTRVAPDIVFNLNIKKDLRKEKKKVAGFSVINLVANERTAYLHDSIFKKYIETVQTLIDKFSDTGYEVRLFAFQNKKEEIKFLSRFRNAELIIYTPDKADFMLKSFSECSCMFATRFHSVILSLLMEIPFYPFIYDEKIKTLLSDIGYKGKSSSNGNLEDVEEIFLYMKKSKPFKINNFLANSQNQFTVLDDLLEYKK